MKAGIDKILKLPQAEYLDSLLPPRDVGEAEGSGGGAVSLSP